jgi:hypothetical protein
MILCQLNVNKKNPELKIFFLAKQSFNYTFCYELSHSLLIYLHIVFSKSLPMSVMSKSDHFDSYTLIKYSKEGVKGT